jgi:hypothetical protein
VIADARFVGWQSIQEEGRNVRRTLIAVGFFAALALGVASPAKAALLTINDFTGGANTVWTLDVQTGCSSCAITLTANVGAGSSLSGTFIDAVQFAIAGTDPTGITVNSAPGGTALWTQPSFDNLDASLSGGNQCNGGAQNNVCFQTDTLPGFGPIASSTTYTWTFTETFASTLPSTLTTGNIRASFNNADSQNVHTFSPGGGDFTNTGSGSGGSSGITLVPEPTSLLLFGTGLSMAAYRARRKKQNDKK